MSKKAGSVTSNDGEDKKDDIQEDMQVLDEVTENDDGTGYAEDDVLEGEEPADEETEYLEAEDDLHEDDVLQEELGEEELAEEDELHEEYAEEAEATEDAEGEKPAEDAAAEEDTEGKEKPKPKKEGETPKKEGEKDLKRTNDREYRERLFLPNYKSLKIDLKIAAKIRSVVAGPLELEDMQTEKVKEILTEAEECFMRFSKGEDSKYTGHVQFRFPTFEEAAAAVEKIEKVKEGLTVKQSVGLNIGIADKLIRGNDDDIEVPAETVKTLVSVCGIPPSTTKEQLLELFPQARIKLMAMKANGTLKGYAYIELDDEDAAKKLVDEHIAKPHVIEGHKLYLEKMQANFELFMVIDSDDVLTDEERAKIVRTLNMSQMQLDRRGTRMKAKEYHDLVRKVKMMKQKLAMDNRKRREKGMALPKPPIRRNIGGMTSTRPTYGMSRGRGLGPRAGAPREIRPRREGVSPRASERSPMPSRRPTHRVDDSYHSGHNPHRASPRGEGYYGPPSARRELGPPRRLDSERGGRFNTSERGSSRYGNSDRGRSGKLNTHQTANAVNMLVGLTSLLSSLPHSEMQRKPVAGGAPERRHSSSTGPATSSTWESRQPSSYSERSRPRSGEYSSNYGSSSSGFRESSSSYREDWGGSRSESARSGARGASGGHSSYDDSYYDERTARKRTLSDRGGYEDDYYSRSDRGAPKRSKIVSRGRGGGRGRY